MAAGWMIGLAAGYLLMRGRSGSSGSGSSNSGGTSSSTGGMGSGGTSSPGRAPSSDSSGGASSPGIGGARGYTQADVAALQQALVDLLGPDILPAYGVDGVLGPETCEALRDALAAGVLTQVVQATGMPPDTAGAIGRACGVM